MNHNRILRVLNLLFLSCNYQIHWFNAGVRKFKITLVAFIYFISLAIWYAMCFQQHFADYSIVGFLDELAPVLYKCVRLHLIIGAKVMIFAVFEMRYIIRALNAFIKVLPKNYSSNCSWKELATYLWIFSGLFINFGFVIYIMVEMEFMAPTLQQIMHFTAMFIPHFALGCSIRLLNVTVWISTTELQNIYNGIRNFFEKEINQDNIQLKNANINSVELSVISKEVQDTEISIQPLIHLTEQLEQLVSAILAINSVLQKQIFFLFSMNAVCLVGATYSIVFYKLAWHLILDGPLGRSFMAFNYGVFVFICWDYVCLWLANYYLEKEKTAFMDHICDILKGKPTIKKDTRSLLKQLRHTLKDKFNLCIFFTSPITWQTLVMVNALIGMGIAIFIIYYYFTDQIENLQMQFTDD